MNEAPDLTKYIPLRRLGTVAEIGYTALFLSSPVASYITGDTIIVDGASYLQRPPFVEKEIYNNFIKKPNNSKL